MCGLAPERTGKPVAPTEETNSGYAPEADDHVAIPRNIPVELERKNTAEETFQFADESQPQVGVLRKLLDSTSHLQS